MCRNYFFPANFKKLMEQKLILIILNTRNLFQRSQNQNSMIIVRFIQQFNYVYIILSNLIPSQPLITLQFHMILDQNYRNIAYLTSKVFRLYARRVFAEAVKDTYEKKRLLGFDRTNQQFKYGEQNTPIVMGKVNIDFNDDQANEQSNIKKALVSTSQIDSNIAEKETVYEIFYGDLVYIIKSDHQTIDFEDKLFLACEMNRIQAWKGVRSSQINIRKYLFRLVHPHQKFGIKQKNRVPFTQNSPVCLFNIQTQKYVKVFKNQIPKKVIGFKVALSQTISSQTIFYPVKVSDRFIQTSKQIFSSSNFKLILKQNNYFKIDIKEQCKINLIEMKSYKMIANYGGCQISFLKQNRQPSKNQISNASTKFPQNSKLMYCYKSYYIKSDTGFYLSSQERKTSSGMKETSYNMFSEGLGRYNVIVDQFANKSIQTSDIMLLSPKQHSNDQYKIHSIWEFKKSNLFSSLEMEDDNQISLMNVATGEYISFHRSSKKAKMGFAPEFYRVSIDEEKFRFKLLEGNIFGCRLNHSNDKYQLGFQQSDAFFTIEEVDEHTSRIVSKSNEFYRVLKNSYKSIWLWGLQKQGNKNDVDYNFYRAATDQYLLQIQISNLMEVLWEIENMLNQEEKNLIKLGEFQNLIKKSKILQILIYFCKLFLIKIVPIKKNKKNMQERTVFMIAKRNIEYSLIFILGLLKRFSKNNKQCSNVIIQFSNFFNSQLTTYPEEVGSLLREAIKNLSILNLNYKGEELFQWVKLLEKPRKQNIQTLNIYISIVAEVVVDPSDRGIQPYQVKCVQFLFNLHGNMRIKNFLLSFHLNQKEEPIVQFSYISQKELLANNPILQQVVCEDERACCSLVALSNKSKTNPSLNYYLIYVYQVIRLYRNLCKDRNKKMSTQMQSIGIKQALIVKIIRSESINAKLKMAFLSLYLQIYIDQDPFIPFTKHQNRCIRYQKLLSKDLTTKTYLIFYPSVQSIRSNIQLSQFIISFIDGYIATSLIQLEKQKTISESVCIHVIYIIKFIKTSVDFGYFQANVIIFKIEGLITLLILLLQKIIKIPDYNEYIAIIVQQMGEFLSLYQKMATQLSILNFFKASYLQTKEQFCMLSREDIEDFIKFFLQGYLFLQKKKLKYDDQKQLKQQIKRHPDNNFRRCQQKIQQFMIQLLISLHTLKNKSFYKNLVKNINSNIQVHLQIMKQISSFELILDQDSVKIAEELNDNQSTRILNINKLEQQVSKLIGQQQITQQQKSSIILQISNLLRKVIKKLIQYRGKSKRLVNVAQRIIEKNQTFTYIRKIFRQCSGQKQFKDLIIIIHQFLQQMVLDNPSLASKLSQDILYIVKMIDSVYIPSLISIIFHYVQDKTKMFQQLIEVMIFKAQTRVYGFKTIRVLLNSLAPIQRTQFNQIIINTIILDPIFKTYLKMKDITDESRQFVKLLVFIISNNQEFREQVKEIFPQREIQINMIQSSYQTKSIYLHLLLHAHLLGPIKKQYPYEHVFTRIILPELQNVFHRINQLFDDRLLRHMKIKDDKNDPSQVEENYKKIKLVMFDWRVTEFKQRYQNIKKRSTKKKTYVLTDQQNNFWEYFYSWNQERYYLIDFIREALQSGVFRIPCQVSDQNVFSFSQKRKQNDSSMIEFQKQISYLTRPMEQQQLHFNSDASKTMPTNFRQQITENFRHHQYQSYKIRPLFREISCLISRLILKYNLHCNQISILSQKLSWICVLMEQSSIFIEDRCFIDRFFRELQLSKYRASKSECSFLEKIFYVVGKIFYKKITTSDLFRTFKVSKNEFIKYSDESEIRDKAMTLSRKQFVLRMEQLYCKSEFQVVQPTKSQNLRQQQKLKYTSLCQIDYILKNTRMSFFNQFYSELSKITVFKQNYYWFIKKLHDTMRCIKNRHMQDIVRDQSKEKFDYQRDNWGVREWLDDIKGEVAGVLKKQQNHKMQEYASKLYNIIREQLKKCANQSKQHQQLLEMFKNFVGVYELNFQNNFMDRFMLVYFQIIHSDNIKVVLPMSLIQLFLNQLSTKHSLTLLKIIKVFFCLAKTKFVGAQIQFDKLKTTISKQMKYIQTKLINCTIQQQMKILEYFKQLIGIVQAFRQIPSTNNKEVIFFMSNSLIYIIQSLSANKKHPHQIFKTTMFYLWQLEQSIHLVFSCKSFISYYKQNFEVLPANIYVTPLQLKEHLYNITLFQTIPRKLRSLKMFDALQQVLCQNSLKRVFLKLINGYLQLKNIKNKAEQKNQISGQFARDYFHRLLMIFQISYEMYHMDYKKFKQFVQPEIKYICLYSQARLRVDSSTKQIKYKSKVSLEYGEELIIQTFQYFINFNCRIQIHKNDKPVQIFFNKPQICNYFNEDIKQQALVEIDKHHKENLYEYIYEISTQVASSLKIHQSLQEFSIGKILTNYQKTIDNWMFRIMLVLLLVLVTIQSTQYYNQAKWLQFFVIIIFSFKTLIFGSKISNLLIGYYKFKQRWFVSFLQQLTKYIYILELMSILCCLFASFRMRLYPLAFLIQCLMNKNVREYTQTMTQQYAILLKYIIFTVFTCILGSIIFAYYDGGVEKPIQYFTTALEMSIGTKVFGPQNYGTNQSIYVKYSGGVVLFYFFKFMSYIFIYTLMASIISSSVQTKSKPYLYNCLICLKPKQTFTIKGSAAFKKHIIQEHNFWNYIFYFIHLEAKEQNIKTADDYYVEKCIKQRNWMFLKMI